MTNLVQVLQHYESGERGRQDRAAIQMLRVLVNSEKVLKDSGVSPSILLAMKNAIRQAKRAGISTKGAL